MLLIFFLLSRLSASFLVRFALHRTFWRFPFFRAPSSNVFVWYWNYTLHRKQTSAYFYSVFFFCFFSLQWVERMGLNWLESLLLVKLAPFYTFSKVTRNSNLDFDSIQSAHRICFSIFHNVVIRRQWTSVATIPMTIITIPALTIIHDFN